MRLLLETLDITVRDSCAFTCIIIAIVCACAGSDLNVIDLVFFFLKGTSLAISSRVRVERKKGSKKSLTRGHLKDTGSTMGIQSYP